MTESNNKQHIRIQCSLCNYPLEEHICCTDRHKLELECPTGDRQKIKFGEAEA